MGYFRMYQVMESLEEVDVTVPRKPTKEQAAKGITNLDYHIGPYELLALLTIAYRQHDLDDEYTKNDDCVCIATQDELAAIVHMKTTKVKEVRNFLRDSGLATFHESVKCKDMKKPYLQKRYYNVWRINEEKLAEYAVEADRIRKQRQAECGHDDDVVNAGCEETSESRQTTSESRQTTSESRQTTSEGRQTATKITQLNITHKDNNNNNTGKAGVVVVDEMEKAEKLRQYIIDRFHLQPEQDKNINVYSMRKVIANKDIRLVKKVIDGYNKPNGYSRSGDDEIISWIKSMMADVRDTVPTTTDACNQSAADLDALLGAPAKVEAEPKDKLIDDGWNTLLNEFKMNELEANPLNELKTAYYNMFKNKPYKTAILSIKKFLDNMTYKRGGSPAAMVAAIPDVGERCKIAFEELKECKND